MPFLDLTDVVVRTMEPLKEDIYEVQVDACETQEIFNGQGHALNTTFKILGGEFDNRNIYHRFVFKTNSDEDGKKKAVEIGQQQLKMFLIASDLPIIIDGPNDLIGGKCSVKIKNRNYNGKIYPEIKYFKKSTVKDDSLDSFI